METNVNPGMDDAAKQSMLGLIRTFLAAVGGLVANKGWADSETVNVIVGAVMVIIPAAWSVWQKYEAAHKAEVLETTALNAGIKLADRTAGPTMLVPQEETKSVIAAVTEGRPVEQSTFR